MSDNKYPYIGDNRLGQIVLIYGKDSVFHIGGQYQGEFSDAYNETGVRNITREYLTNTYGKCESQEHADFICKLAESAGIKQAGIRGCSYMHYSTSDCFNFFTDENDDLVFGFFGVKSASSSGEKLIHLPLPPKEKEMPEVKEQKPIYTKEMHERGEYPPIGSKVKLRVGYGVVVLGVDSNGFFPVLTNGKYQLLDVGSVKPIPTIEDELIEIIKSTAGVDRMVSKILSKYNITPKGE